MENWRQIARNNRTAATQLFHAGQWRSCVSRAYYAIYSDITHAPLAARVTMPAGQNNPKHIGLPLVVGHNLSLIRPAARWRLSGIVKRAYDLRILADYMPAMDVVEAEARVALALVEQAFDILKAVP